MKKRPSKKLPSPVIFAAYVAASCFAVMAFRYVSPGASAPLPIYAVKWRLITGLLDVCAFFPAIALAGLVVPFGIRVEDIKPFPRFSPYFFSLIRTTVVTAICVAALYGALFFLVEPLSQNYRGTLIFNGDLFRQSKKTAQEEANEGRWLDAEKSMLVCKRIWAKSEEIKSLAEQIQINAAEMRLANAADESRKLYNIREFQEARSDKNPEEQEARDPMNIAEALAWARKALDERRFYDAYWLAGVGTRLAKKNGPEYRQAVLIEANAWEAINQPGTSAQESEASAFYREKKNGYLAIGDEDWLKAYHIFYGLAMKNPGDPDIANSLALSKEKVASSAFFLSDKELTLGEIIPSAFCSLPAQNARVVIRIGYLTLFSNAAYGRNVEIDAIDHENRVLCQVKTPYCKILPQADNESLLLMLRAVENNEQFDPVITGVNASLFENAQIRLDINYENFILLSKVRRGLDSFFISELFRAERKFGDYGYIPQVFQADIVYRIFEAAVFLPIAVSVIILGWRFRVKRKPQLIGIPMLLILPFVFNIFVLMCRAFINKMSILSVIGIGFVNSLVVFAVGTVVCFFFALTGLAAQREI
ncbi:MAG: hypothetical protein LBE74_06880 [Treponema sp.]|jgi:hypothetical protein|nr:hypothetical protein [Treponema sp.]